MIGEASLTSIVLVATFRGSGRLCSALTTKVPSSNICYSAKISFFPLKPEQTSSSV